jgi:hypothetical protein
MDVIDQLDVIDGYFDGDRFYMRGIAGYAIEGRYEATGLRTMARLIDEKESFSFVVDGKLLHVPVELNSKIKRELNLIADALLQKNIE